MTPLQNSSTDVVRTKNQNGSKLFQCLFAKKKSLIPICMTFFCTSTKNVLQSNEKTISKHCNYNGVELKAQIKRLFWILK